MRVKQLFSFVIFWILSGLSGLQIVIDGVSGWIHSYACQRALHEHESSIFLSLYKMVLFSWWFIKLLKLNIWTLSQCYAKQEQIFHQLFPYFFN